MTTRGETDRVPAAEQLAALARIHELLDGQGIEYWLFGGWAVDFHAGSVTRTHDDLDIAVWLKDHNRIAALLAAEGWRHAPEGHEDGYIRYERGALREGRAAWPEEALEDDVAELAGVRARVISLRALKADKAERRDDPIVAAKDRADLATLSMLS